MSRAEEIKTRLTEHFASVGVAVTAAHKDAWNSFPPAPRHSYGWIPPIAFGEPALCVCFCPELLDEQTTWLDEEQLDHYLSVIEFTIDRHVQYWGEMPEEELARRVDGEIIDHFPTSMSLLNRVQMRALDQKV